MHSLNFTLVCYVPDIYTTRLISKHTLNSLKNLTVTLLERLSKQQMHLQNPVSRLS